MSVPVKLWIIVKTKRIDRTLKLN